MKRSIAKLILLTSIVLSAFSVAGSIATLGKDGGNPTPPCPPTCVVQPNDLGNSI
jgi:hypothetical protein